MQLTFLHFTIQKSNKPSHNTQPIDNGESINRIELSLNNRCSTIFGNVKMLYEKYQPMAISHFTINASEDFKTPIVTDAE